MTRMPAFPPGPCAETDPELWFPERGNDMTADRARNICRSSCLSRVECLAFALAHHEEGIWGGFNEKGRERAGRLLRDGRSLEDIIAADDAKFYARLEKAQADAVAAVARKRSRARELDRERAALRRAA
jgi:WhiB family transcriptional regulator, redox-sensing transcriptional regulator